MNRIYLALGSNVGDKKKNIQQAITLLRKKVSNIKIASFYETKAVGYTEQDNFINTAIEGNTALTPEELLVFIKDVEKKVGRIKRFLNGPREIDIDILFYNNHLLKKDDLQIPHPRLHERDFVLKPLTDLDPMLYHPICKKTVSELLKDLPKGTVSIIQNE